MGVANTKKDALVEGLKEFLRIVVIAAVSAALTTATSYATGVRDPLLQTALLMLLTGLGKAWDKYRHKDPDTTAQGVVPF